MSALYLLLGVVVIWVVFRLLVGSRRVPPTPPRQTNESPKRTVGYEDRSPAGTPRSQSDRDEWEGSFWEVSQPFPVRATIRIKYTDGAGSRSERTVDVRQFGLLGSTALLIGHCHLRDATRTFRTDRIESCTDVETGEVVNDVRAFLQVKHDASPEGVKGRLLESEYDTLRVLLYVGKADGQLRAAEKAVIRDTCIAITGDSRLDDTTIESLFTTMDVPTPMAFKQAVGRLAKRDQSARSTVLEAAEKMVATQKVVAPSEQEALDYMRKRFEGKAQEAT